MQDQPSRSAAPPDSDTRTAHERPPGLRLDLDDPAAVRAPEDRPEAWGDESADDLSLLAEYRRNTPPHHG